MTDAETAIFEVGLIFAAMTGLWCVLGYALVGHPSIRTPIRQYSRWVLPLVLIAIGAISLIH